MSASYKLAVARHRAGHAAGAAGGDRDIRHIPFTRADPAAGLVPIDLQRLSAIQVLDALEIPYVALLTRERRVHVSRAVEQVFPGGAAGRLPRPLLDVLESDTHQDDRPVRCHVLQLAGQGYRVAVRTVNIDGERTRLAVLTARVHADPTPGPQSRISAREAEIARLIAAGASAKRIACLLTISEHTVRHHTEHIFEKLGVGSRAAVAAIASTWA